MLCKDNMPTLITNPRYIIQNTFFLSPFIFYFFILKGIAKTTYHKMHEFYPMQILKAQKKTKQQSPG